MGNLLNPYVATTSRKLSHEGLKNSSAKLIPPYSVILSSRAPIGHLVINTVPMSFNQGCKGIRPNESLDFKFLFYYLYSKVELLNSLGSGATFKELSSLKLKNVEIPLPPLPEQRRIVAILDEAFEGIEAAKANSETNIKNIHTVLISHLNSVFSHTGNKGYYKKIHEISHHSLGKMLDRSKNKGELKPYLRNLNVRWFDFDLSDLQEMRFLPTENEKYSVIKGDVLVCEGGYPGRAAIWNRNEPIFFQKALHRVRFHVPEHSKWFMYYLYSQHFNGHLSHHFTGTGIQHLTGMALAQISIPIPPLPQINKYLLTFDNLLNDTLQLAQNQNKKLKLLESFKTTLLHQAFTGQL